MSGTPSIAEQKMDRIIQGGLDPTEAPQLLDELFHAKDYTDVLRRCPDPQRYIDGLYQISHSLPPDLLVHRRCFGGLRKAGGHFGVLPTDHHVTTSFAIQNKLPNAAGGSADIWKVRDPAGGSLAVKILRVTKEDDFGKIRKKFCKEVLVAKLVENENVLSIRGVQIVDGFKFCIISEWMEYGNMHDYIERYPSINRVELLLGVTKGLSYLHTIPGVVHGDLKSTNILIDSKRNPRLTDFGVSSVAKNLTVNVSTEGPRGTMRWQAPELLPLSTNVEELDKVKAIRPTNESDMYSLAMVVIEIFTGKYPFEPYSNVQVIILLTQDKRPEKPSHEQFSQKIWTLTQKCWDKDPKERPKVSEVLNKLEGNNILRSLSASLSAFIGSQINLFGGGSDTNRLG